MRHAYLIVLFLCALAAAEERWWQDLFHAEDAPSPPRAEVTDPLLVDASLDQCPDAHRGLLWMLVVPGLDELRDLNEVFQRESEMRAEPQDVVRALLMDLSARNVSMDDVLAQNPPNISLGGVRMRTDPIDLDDLRVLVARYQESQGRRPEGMVIGQTMVMPAVFDSGEPVMRWVGRNVLPVLPDTVVEWGRDVELRDRFSWSFERYSMSGEPSLLDRHVEESVKQVDVRVVRSLHFEFGFRRELLNNQPEDDLFEGGSGSSEPFASLMWRF